MSVPLRSLDLGLLPNDTVEAAGGSTRATGGAEHSQRLESWFREHFDTLWRLAARLGVSHDQVDDVVQEAFIIAERRAVDIVAGSERRFLISATVKLSANYRRRQHTSIEHAADIAREQPRESAADAEQVIAHKQLWQLLDFALNELPLEQRTVLVLHELEGFSSAEIAELLHVPAGTVASRLARARLKFSKAAARLRARWPEHR